jgi:hypothetical protein
MPTSKFEKFLPYTGVLAGILFAVSGFVAKTSDKFADPNALQIMKDNEVRNGIAMIASAFCCVALLFFVSAVRQALRSRETGESTYSSAAYAGGVLIASSMAIQAWLMFAGADAVNQDDKAALNTLSYLGIDSWVIWVAPSAVFFLATGLGGLRNAALPKWLGITTVVLGVLCLLGPTGIAVYFATPVWLAVTGIVLSRQSDPQHVSLPGQAVHV